MKQVTKKLLLGAAVWLGSTLVCSLFCLLALSRDFSSMPPMLWTVPLLLGTLNMLLTYVGQLVGYLEEKSYRSDAPSSWTVPLSLLAMWSAAFITTGAVCKGFSLLTGMAVSWRTLVLLSGLCGATVAAHSPESPPPTTQRSAVWCCVFIPIPPLHTVNSNQNHTMLIIVMVPQFHIFCKPVYNPKVTVFAFRKEPHVTMLAMKHFKFSPLFFLLPDASDGIIRRAFLPIRHG